MNKIQEKLTSIWKEVLQDSEFGIRDNFFEVGGTSANIILLNDMIADTYPECIKVTDIFSNPTIEGLSVLISQRIGESKEDKKEAFDF